MELEFLLFTFRERGREFLSGIGESTTNPRGQKAPSDATRLG